MKESSLLVDLKGEPGINCNGFCKFCYFRKVDKKNPKPLGCRYCQFTFGCDYCTYSVREINGDFIPLPLALMEVQSSLLFKRYKKVNITGGGDISCYPQLVDLCKFINNMGLNIHLGYTSGKGFDNIDIAKNLVDYGVDEVTFSVFSTNAKLRKEWMNDKNAETALKCLKYFCEHCEVHCAIIVIPGVNDGEELKRTVSDLVDWGAKAVILMRFANSEEQGLILGNAPLLENIKTHTVEEFKKIIDEIHNEFGDSIRVTGTPLYDPITKTPFALADDENKHILERLKNKINGEATIITGNVAYPFLKKIFDETSVNVVRVNKDIADLITSKDLENLNLKDVKETVFIPPKAFVHDRVAEDLLRRDGIDRIVVRGVEQLTLDGEVSGVYSKKEALEFEINAFEELIGMINFFGMRKR
ncbi:[Methyl-coenzyme M reductase subunit alpha]-arginine C-methyltransferase [Methanocaldococcus lauensis]|uniref:[Methyl-coenzyme M reductase subunit alpha]-arginine C-methyltransferase n=1 Tax=Methanocaldococcus lauensis TaxID=2546128 RepID=A0A8D6PUF9_9EURY|nr:methyl coenzyme M reductase-arginine methyltransferase Mmp10 [Methanocaldococcus lauensis]CAB3287722.1 [Methyl-coenzyme M reductase subunit alpha]-arginine C-methyltransferase [Methanocaldococcus lauensis]